MPDRENVISGLHCRAQDLMIDLPACDGCDYQIQIVNRMGCDFRRLCRDALALLKEQEAVVRCKDCRFRDDPQSVISMWLPCQFAETPNEWYCASGKKLKEGG